MTNEQRAEQVITNFPYFNFRRFIISSNKYKD